MEDINRKENIITLSNGDIVKVGDYIKVMSQTRHPDAEFTGIVLRINNANVLAINSMYGEWWTHASYIIKKIPRDEGVLIRLAENW